MSPETLQEVHSLSCIDKGPLNSVSSLQLRRVQELKWQLDIEMSLCSSNCHGLHCPRAIALSAVELLATGSRRIPAHLTRLSCGRAMLEAYAALSDAEMVRMAPCQGEVVHESRVGPEVSSAA